VNDDLKHLQGNAPLNFKTKLKLALAVIVLVLPLAGRMFQRFEQPAQQFKKLIGSEIPASAGSTLVEYSSHGDTKVFVFEGNQEFISTLQYQVCGKPIWLSPGGRDYSHIIKLIRGHKLFENIEKENRLVIFTQAPGVSPSIVVWFCSDISSRAWVVVAHDQSFVAAYAYYLSVIVWLWACVYLIRYWWRKKQAPVPVE